MSGIGRNPHVSDRRIVLVTGANRGLGLEVSRQLLAEGCVVVLTARNAEAGQRAFHELSAPQDAAVFHPLNLTDERSMLALRAVLEGTHGRLDTLVNNAAVSIGGSGTANVAMDAMRATFETNVFGALRLTQVLLPLLRRGNAPRIVNVSSGMGTTGGLAGGYAAYRASKAALNALTIAMAHDLKDDGIAAHAVCPGWVRTDMGGPAAPRSVEEGADSIAWLATTDDAESGRMYRDRKPLPW
jgi:NAD(P)-dependent dehydrogenase (short-subunit alcohol dehydrogenase family)